MTTLQDIITRAYREHQITDIAVAPSTDQTSEALVLLKGIISRRIRQLPQSILWVGTQPTRSQTRKLRNFTPHKGKLALPQNVYVYCTLTEATTLFMPYNPGDGARIMFVDVGGNFSSNNLKLEGNGALIDAAPDVTLNTSGQRADFFFRRDLAQWKSVTQLVATSTMIFPDEFDDLFVLELAARLMPRYGKELDAFSATLFGEMRDRFDARYARQSSDVEPDNIFESEFVSTDSAGGVGDGQSF